MAGTDADGLKRLQSAHADGELETVRICFPDHYGVLRGRRMVAERFLSDPSARQAFCDGALVWDIRCDIFEEVDFSNYRTGYPDLYAHADLSTVRPCGWSEREFVLMADCRDAHGAPLEVDPRQALRRAVERNGEIELAIAFQLRVEDPGEITGLGPGRAADYAGRLSESLAESEVGLIGAGWDRGQRLLTIDLAGAPAIAAADATVISRSAAREIALTSGVDMTCLPRLRADQDAAALRLTLPLGNVDLERLRGLLADVDLLLRPLPIAHGGVLPLRVEAHGGQVTVSASSDANPYLAAVAVIAALGEAASDTKADPVQSWGYGEAIRRFAAAEWTGRWLDGLLAHDAMALARRELALRAEQVSDWDLQRYRECG